VATDARAWLGLLLVACAGCISARPEGAPIGAVSEQVAAQQEQAELHPPSDAGASGPALPRDVVARAALPFHGVRAQGAQDLSPDELMQALSQAQVVCVGEQHDNPHDHYAELAILRGLARRAPVAGREVGLGLEMVEVSNQSALDDYAAGKSDDDDLLEALDWNKTWGFDFSYYRPLFELAQRRGLDLVALNAPAKLVHQVAQSGLDGLSDAQRAKLPKMQLSDAQHRAYFDQAMRGHPDAGNLDNLYQAQVLRDETMASRAAKWISASFPARQLVIVAGSAHCIRSGIVRRILRRVPSAHVTNVKPIVASGDSNPKSELSRYDYGFVMTAE
jgi:uncharacterized iron-regulated protein